MTQPVFPKSILSWTDRVDQISNVLANDPNSIAADLISVESVLGTMPQVEASPFTGNPVTYNTVNARLSDMLAGNQHPVCTLNFNNLTVANTAKSGTHYGAYNSYNALYDPFSYFNGTDVTIQSTGLYIIDAYQSWQWYDQGFVGMGLIISNTFTKGDIWKWSGFSSSGNGSYTDDRFANTGLTWLGILSAGTRVRIISENNTNLNPYPLPNGYLRVYAERKTPPGQIG
jgi:hypothetical protein